MEKEEVKKINYKIEEKSDKSFKDEKNKDTIIENKSSKKNDIKKAETGNEIEKSKNNQIQLETKKEENGIKNQSEPAIEKTKIQKIKNEIELIEIFGNLERKLIDVLQTIPKNISGENKSDIKSNVKSYVDKVEMARKIFDEYEKTAKLITAMSEAKEDDQESIEISKKVIEQNEELDKIDGKDLLKQVQAIEKQTNGLEKIEIETIGNKVIVKKRKDLTKEY